MIYLKSYIINFLVIIYISLSSTQDLYVDILGTNDVHGAAIELNKKQDEQEYMRGGFKLLSGLVNILRKDNPKGVLWLDGGDQFQGTLENYKTSGELITDFYNLMDLDATTIGNHEWDWGKDRIIKFINNAQYPYLVANMERKSPEEIQEILKTISDQKAKDELNKSLEKLVQDYDNKLMKTKVFEFHDGQIKIGVIGLTTIETYTSTSMPPIDYDIDDQYAQIVIEQSQKLREEEGVHAVLVVSHIGILCSPENVNEFKRYRVRTIYNLKNNSVKCNEREIAKFIHKIPEGTIDGWVAGHVHDTVHNFLNGIPIVQNPLGGQYANVIRLNFKYDENQYRVDSKKTLIQGPIPLCSHVFKQNMRCDTVPKDKNMKVFKFKNSTLTSEIDQRVLDLFSSDKYKGVVDLVMKMRQNVIFSVDDDFLNIKTDFNPLGALLGQALKRNFLSKNQDYDPNKVISILGYGGFRSEFFAGEVSEADMNTMFPFKGNVASFNVTGDQLLKMTTILQSGKRAFYSYTGLYMKVTKEPSLSFIEGSARLDNGDIVNSDDQFTILTFSFNVLNAGGDDFKTVFSQGVIDKSKLQYQILGGDLEYISAGFENKVYKLKDIQDNNNLIVVQSRNEKIKFFNKRENIIKKKLKKINNNNQNNKKNKKSN
ncbi:hypothetical protein IMG5_058530 [Ichthyophthirius multifiliis]|uniref:5'-nucleotidase n=1 Tax=Ichthyophthirius multifiliis TaxID=5932 RepID=G0QNH1_ICHMU|nr:hypothetical protein IMG5_058530 [Ichthyophthirius multifiliis]EGR33233.1 hypothetical protein IMG5_058530 [Ichthyophthirius multifiliis]|eukprot:XP_004037219.1 hypothetical protein IMG5_058530 [Ichthyophthirius multifiliis]